MTRRLVTVAATGLVLALTAPAAARDRMPSIRDLRSSLESTDPTCDLEVEEELRLGPTKLWLVRRVAAMTDDVDEEAKAILDGLRRVEVGSYRIVGETDGCTVSGRLVTHLLDAGWLQAARMQDGSGESLVLHRSDENGDLDALLVVEIDGGTVELVRLEGRIGEVLAAAIAGQPDRATSLLAID
jgi:hypothetical protein